MKLIICLFFSLTLCSADQLDFANHHDSGAAVVRYEENIFIAAYQQDTFDLMHDPEIPVKVLSRIILAPDDVKYLSLAGSNGMAQCHIDINEHNHPVITWGSWSMELISTDVNLRAAYAKLPIAHGPVMLRRLLVKPVRDALVLTIYEGK